MWNLIRNNLDAAPETFTNCPTTGPGYKVMEVEVEATTDSQHTFFGMDFNNNVIFYKSSEERDGVRLFALDSITGKARAVVIYDKFALVFPYIYSTSTPGYFESLRHISLAVAVNINSLLVASVDFSKSWCSKESIKASENDVRSLFHCISQNEFMKEMQALMYAPLENDIEYFQEFSDEAEIITFYRWLNKHNLFQSWVKNYTIHRRVCYELLISDYPLDDWLQASIDFENSFEGKDFWERWNDSYQKDMEDR